MRSDVEYAESVLAALEAIGEDIDIIAASQGERLEMKLQSPEDAAESAEMAALLRELHEIHIARNSETWRHSLYANLFAVFSATDSKVAMNRLIRLASTATRAAIAIACQRRNEVLESTENEESTLEDVQ